MKSRSSLTSIIGLVILLKSSFTIASVSEPFLIEDPESRSDVTFLNLDSSFFTTSAEACESLSNADVVCIQNIKSEDSAYDLYELFKTNYPYLLCLPITSQIDGLIMASKYPAENLQFNEFEDSRNEGYIDFDITNDQGLSAHIYATYWQRDALEEETRKRFQNVMQKMQQDETSTFFLSSNTFLTTSFTNNIRIIPIKSSKHGDEDKSGGSIKGKAGYEWGGSDGGKWTFGAEAEYHDKHGNYGEARVNRDSEGRGRAEVEGGKKTN